MEKKTKNKFLSTITRYIISFLFLSSWIVLGFALALKSSNVDLGGSITFTATGINANITGVVTGTKTENNLPNIKIDRTVSSFTTPDAWKNMTLDFDENNEIVIKVNIENLSSSHDFWVTFDDNISSANTVITRTQEQKTVENFSNMVVKSGETQTIDITLNVENKNIKVNGNFVLALNLTNERVAVDESVYADAMSFNSFNTSAKTCAVTNAGDTTITTLDIPASILHNGVEYKVTTIANNAFKGYNSLTKIKLPNTITQIGDYGFAQCTNLEQINIPDGVTIIGNAVLTNCTKLTALTLPSTLKTIGTYFLSKSAVQTLTIPSAVTKIGGRFLWQATTSQVVFDNTIGWVLGTENIDVTNPEANATKATTATNDLSWTRTAPKDTDYAGLTFTYNNTTKTASVKGADTTQTSIVIPYDITCNQTNTGGGTIGTTYKVTEISGSAFNNYSALTSVTIPAGVTQIGSNAFQYSKITSVIFDGTSSLTSIGAAAFSSCANLTSIIIPASLTSIGASAFQDCTKLASVTFIGTSGLTSIKDGAFANCEKLTSMIIPASVTSIGVNAFRSCIFTNGVTFETTSGWKAGSTTLSPSDLADTSIAATYLKDEYRASAWTRS